MNIINVLQGKNYVIMMALAITLKIKPIFFSWILESKVNMISNTTYKEKMQTWLV